MNSERDTARIVRSWLENGVTDLPDRILDRVLDQLPSTPQRRHPWHARRFLAMNSPFKFVTAAAAVVVGVIAIALLPGTTPPGVGATPPPAPTPTAAPTSAVSGSPISLLPTYHAELEPGRYSIGNLPIAGTMSIAVPAGWTAGGTDLIAKDYGVTAETAGALFAVWPISGTFVDPCTKHDLVRPAPTDIDSLAEALADQPGTTAVRPTAVTVDGYRAKVVEVTVTADIAKCLPTGEGFWLWAAPGGDRRYVQGTGEMNRIYLVDVDGTMLTFNGRFPAATTAADRAELDAIIASIDIRP
jgi:hypothetical protein